MHKKSHLPSSDGVAGHDPLQPPHERITRQFIKH
jgi:hypothetical protein